MPEYDALFVGSGVNSLASAALLSQAGWRVCVLERADRLGGAIRTAGDLTEPGFTHEVLSSWHPLFVGSAAYAELADALARHGLEYLNTEHPTGSLYPDGSAAFLSTSLDENIAEFERLGAGDGEAWKRQFEEFMGSAELSFGVLSSELWSLQGALARARRLPQARSPGAPLLRRHDARERARLARGDVRLRCRARAARAVGAAHRARARAGRLRLHDPGDRLRGAARRHAGPAGRRHPARRGARGDRARGRGRAAHRRGRPAHPGRGGTRHRCRARRRRAGARRARRDRERHPDAAVRVAARRAARPSRGRALGRGLPLRPRGHADPPCAERAARCGPRARPSASARPRSCT